MLARVRTDPLTDVHGSGFQHMVKGVQGIDEEDAVFVEYGFLLVAVDDGDMRDAGLQCRQHIPFGVIANHQSALRIKSAGFQDRRKEFRRPFPQRISKAVAAKITVEMRRSVNIAQPANREFKQSRHAGVGGCGKQFDVLALQGFDKKHGVFRNHHALFDILPKQIPVEFSGNSQWLEKFENATGFDIPDLPDFCQSGFSRNRFTLHQQAQKLFQRRYRKIFVPYRCRNGAVDVNQNDIDRYARVFTLCGHWIYTLRLDLIIR